MRIEQYGDTYFLVQNNEAKALTKNRTKAISLANKLSLVIVLD